MKLKKYRKREKREKEKKEKKRQDLTPIVNCHPSLGYMYIHGTERVLNCMFVKVM